MPNKKEYSKETSVRTLQSFPTILERNPKLLRVLEERNIFSGEKTPSDILLNWNNDTKKIEKFQFLGWLMGGIETMRMSAMFYIKLHEKTTLVECVNAILAYASETEKEAYKNARMKVCRRYGKKTNFSE